MCAENKIRLAVLVHQPSTGLQPLKLDVVLVHYPVSNQSRGARFKHCLSEGGCISFFFNLS